MNQNQIKAIQSRLSTRGKKLTLSQIRQYALINYHDEEFTEGQMSEIVEKLALSTAAIVSSNGELSHAEKQTLIQQVASTLEVSLSVEQIKQISNKMEWAISDRSSLKDRIKSAIVAWVDYQVDQDKLRTDEMMEEVESHFATRLLEANQHFNSKATAFSGRIEEARDKFRTTETEILNLFKIPS